MADQWLHENDCVQSSGHSFVREISRIPALPVSHVTSIVAVVLLAWTTLCYADSDGDGRLDVLDSPRYDTSAAPSLVLNSQGIEDLDGTSGLSPELLYLYLGNNQITEIEVGDLTGLQTQYLYFYNNQINEIEPGAFAGLTLRDLNLNNNHFSDLHLEGGTYELLHHLGIDRADVKRLYLDDARVSTFSYEEITRETTEITDLSLVGTEFLDPPPENLSAILSALNLEQVTVDQELFEQYRTDFEAFAAMPGNTLSVIEPFDEDCNQSGGIEWNDLGCVENLLQRDAVLISLAAPLGDIDGDDRVGFDDFVILANHFGLSNQSYLQGNLDLESTVGFDDFLILAENLGARGTGSQAFGTTASVPEPNTCLSWFLMVLWLRKRARAGLPMERFMEEV